MPFIDVKVSKTLGKNEIDTIKTRLGKTISIISGKSENYLMVNITDNCHLYFKGNQNEPTSMTDVSIYGTACREDCKKFTAEICNILFEEAQIPSNRSYVKYQFIENWGYDGFMF